MPGWLDALTSTVGSLFGGGGGGGSSDPYDWSNLLPALDSTSGGGVDWSSLGQNLIPGGSGGSNPFDFSGFNFGSLPTVAGGGIDWGSILNGGGFDPSNPNPSDFQINPGSAPVNWGNLDTSFLTPPDGGFTIPGGVPGGGNVPGSVPGGGGGGTPQGGAPGGAQGPAKNPIQQLLGGNGTGILGTGINLPQLLAGAGGIAGLFTNNGLGPGADALNTMAKGGEDLRTNQILPTALANQQGNISGPALDSINRKLQRTEAGIRGAYGNMDMSGSTMEQQDLADARSKSQDEAFAESQQMAATGFQEAAALSGQDSGIYESLMQQQVAQDAALQQAIARVAAAFAGNTPTAAGATS